MNLLSSNPDDKLRASVYNSVIIGFP